MSRERDFKVFASDIYLRTNAVWNAAGDDWELLEPSTAAVMRGAAADLAPSPNARLYRRRGPSYACRRADHHGEGEAMVEATDTPVYEEPTDWIEIILEDEQQRPVANVRCELVLPDGSKRHGTTNRDGLIRYEGVPSGECKVSFVELAGSTWNSKA